MSQEVQGNIKTFKAADISVPAYRIVTLSAAQTVDIPNTLTSVLIGITANDGSATNDAIGVVLNGTAKCACGASVDAGAILTVQTSTGKCIAGTQLLNTTTTAVPRTIGIALDAGSTNSVIEVAIIPNNVRIAFA